MRKRWMQAAAAVVITSLICMGCSTGKGGNAESPAKSETAAGETAAGKMQPEMQQKKRGRMQPEMLQKKHSRKLLRQRPGSR